MHEAWHYLQNSANPSAFGGLAWFGDSPFNPLEWTQPAASTSWQLPGAYNMEAITPYGLWVQAALSLQLLTGQVNEAGGR